MNNNYEIKVLSTNNQNIKPQIFTKKINDNYKVIPFFKTRSTLGQTRHFPPATREWFNSIYTYNNNSIKNLSNADKNLSRLIKSYFNLYFNKNVFKKNKKFSTRFKRLSLNKIFISKAELKHTNSKVIITLYVYNEESRLLKARLERVLDILIPKIRVSLHNRKMHKTPFSLEKKLLLLENKNHNYLNLGLFKNIFKREIRVITYYKLLLSLNKSKFQYNFLMKLKPLISKIYNKEVEFNIVNLKALYLNSDIFTQAITLKIRNRNNKLFKVLNTSLDMIELPKNTNKVKDKYGATGSDQLWLNKVKNLDIFSDLSSKDSNKDLLSQLLLYILPSSSPIVSTSNVELLDNQTSSSNVESIVFDSLKHKTTVGVRLEAKGRLTRRFTASRSVFKIKWKGSLKNIDSSYRGLSSIILRGHLRPNLQYSIVNSKTRNGSFGLKGWLSSY